jgi:ankyrin repeat protein
LSPLLCFLGFISLPLTVAQIDLHIPAKGADIKGRNTSGWTALMAAALGNQNPDMIDPLIKNGANIKMRDDLGQTALDLAAENRYIKGTEAFWKLKEAINK